MPKVPTPIRYLPTITDHIEKFRFNSAVARIRELTNSLEELSDGPGAGAVMRDGVETAVRLIGPMMPHLAEELWQLLGHDTLLADERWPEADPALVVEESQIDEIISMIGMVLKEIA